MRAGSVDDGAGLGSRLVEFERIVNRLAHNYQPRVLRDGFKIIRVKQAFLNLCEPITGAGFPSSRRRFV